MMMSLIYIIMLMLNSFLLNKFMLMNMMSINLMMLILMMIMKINFTDNWMLMYNWLGGDSMSVLLMILSIWIISMMFLISLKFKIKNFYSLILLLLLLSLMLSFMTINYFMFYFWFEVSLFPTFLLIMGWGYQPERLNASMFMLMYTLFASLPLMFIIFWLFNYLNSLNYLIMLNSLINMKSNQFMFYWFMIFAFLVKLPIFLFHMWLPKAHVEAPVTGSMILAGIMLKLGGYGLMRSMLMMLNYSIKFSYKLMIISLIGMMILSLVCLRQYDMKLLVAYSSVVHMGMMLIGIFSLSYWGYLGGLLMMLAHGLCSSALFMLVNMFYYRSNSRNMYMNKGMIMIFPSLVMWWFMFCVCNMSAPISLNLLSEIMIINILLNWSINILLILILGMYISAMYSLFLFSFVSHGENINKIKINNNININEFMNLLFHWIPLNFFILKMELFF
uniref:NADH-ubiquinone oxidoreductase chain 4 n=1 Tax=Philotrypesis pilosa TaxID=358048 RepID=G8EEK3_9HYME|nr:NADH dehydrogenase subunit 4 [Philotrypesis pilosa]